MRNTSTLKQCAWVSSMLIAATLQIGCSDSTTDYTNGEPDAAAASPFDVVESGAESGGAEETTAEISTGDQDLPYCD